MATDDRTPSRTAPPTVDEEGPKKPGPTHPLSAFVVWLSRAHAPLWLLLVVASAALWGYVDLLQRVKSDGDARSDEVRLVTAPVEPPSNSTVGGDAHGMDTTGRGRLDPLQCTGIVPEEDVQATLARQGHQPFGCHRSLADRGIHVDADFTALLVIDSAGMVDSIHHSGLDDGEGHHELLRCALQSLLGWRFTAPTGGTCAVVRVPFRFRQRQ